MSDTAQIGGVSVSTAHFIGGKRVASFRTFEDRSPIDRLHLADVAAGGADEVEAAVAAARTAFPPGPHLDPRGACRS